MQLGLLDSFDGSGGADSAADIFNRAAAQAFGGMGH